jgi:hypothetical protein
MTGNGLFACPQGAGAPSALQLAPPQQFREESLVRSCASSGGLEKFRRIIFVDRLPVRREENVPSAGTFRRIIAERCHDNRPARRRKISASLHNGFLRWHFALASPRRRNVAAQVTREATRTAQKGSVCYFGPKPLCELLYLLQVIVQVLWQLLPDIFDLLGNRSG